MHDGPNESPFFRNDDSATRSDIFIGDIGNFHISEIDVGAALWAIRRGRLDWGAVHVLAVKTHHLALPVVFFLLMMAFYEVRNRARFDPNGRGFSL